MWKNVIRKYYSVQKISEWQMDKIIFDHFDYITQRYETDKKSIPPANLIEIRYEELEKHPFDVVQNIYEKLNLPGFNETSQRLLKRLEVENRYKKFEYRFNKEIFDKVETRWKKYIEQWNYKAVESVI